MSAPRRLHDDFWRRVFRCSTAVRMRVARTLLLSCAALVVPLMVIAGQPASASAYSSCKPLPNDNHCYAIAEWAIVPNEVYGSNAWVMASKSSVEHWESNFVDNELWTDFSSTTWIEAGFITGDCCGAHSGNGSTPTAFYGSSTASNGFSSYDLGVEGGLEKWLSIENDNEGSGYWATWVDGAGPLGANGAEPEDTIDLQDGLEMTEAYPEIVDNGQSYDTMWRDRSNAWHYGWNDAYTHAVRHTPGIEGENTSPTCVQPTGYREPDGELWLGTAAWVSYPLEGPPGTCFEGEAGEPYVASDAESGTISKPALPPGAESAWTNYKEPAGPSTLAAEQLHSSALASASAQGDSSPAGMESVKSNLRSVLEALTNNAALPSPSSIAGPWLESPAYLVSMTGDFTYSGPIPAGASDPTGTVLSLAINAHTGQVEGEHLGGLNSAPNLASLGSEEALQ